MYLLTNCILHKTYTKYVNKLFFPIVKNIHVYLERIHSNTFFDPNTDKTQEIHLNTPEYNFCVVK